MEKAAKKQKMIFGMNRSVFMKKYGIFIVLLIMIAFMCVASPTFRTWGNVVSILQQVSVNGVLALGMVFVITAGGIDLSIGSMLALTSVIIGKSFEFSDSIWLAIILSVVVCAAFGFINGALIAKFNMFPFVVTLSTQLVIRGIGYIICDGETKTLANKAFRQIGLGKLGGSSSLLDSDSFGGGCSCLYPAPLDQVRPSYLCSWRKHECSDCFRR